MSKIRLWKRANKANKVIMIRRFLASECQLRNKYKQINKNKKDRSRSRSRSKRKRYRLSKFCKLKISKKKEIRFLRIVTIKD